MRVGDSSEYLPARGEVPAGGRVKEGGEVNKLPLQMCVSGGQLLSLSVQHTFILQRLLQQVSILAQTEEYHICNVLFHCCFGTNTHGHTHQRQLVLLR